MEIIDESKINEILKETAGPGGSVISGILERAREKKGLSLRDVGYLVNLNDGRLEEGLFEAAGYVKEQIYGERLVFFAPLYVSDFCANDCEYCNFHTRNREITRRKLSPDEIGEQARHLIDMGHKRVLLECGEDPVNNDIGYVVGAIEKIYSVKTDKGSIRRINVNIAATTTENYRRLKEARIGTYQLFQETYHRRTYESLHKGPKADYDRQITAHERAFEAGIDDLGIGALFGLYDWRFEALALVAHAQYMERKFGVGPHTISVPRFRPAPGVTYAPAFPVSDGDFLKIIAILRVAVPYAGMIISTREMPGIRKIAFRIGISQASAGSVTATGGYGKQPQQGQFTICDERALGEVIKDSLDDKLLPSFCTACYRSGRTGASFMGLAKPGDIHGFCRPNGLLTFAEYLEDFCNNGIYEKGSGVIEFYLNKIEDEAMRAQTRERLGRIRQGERDLYF